MAAQIRLRSAKVLLINLGGLGSEIVKNLVLGGLNSIEILDDSTVLEEDFGAQFFLANDLSVVGHLKLPLVIDNIRELNTRVNLTSNTSSLESQLQDDKQDYFLGFDLIIATEVELPELLKLNQITRQSNIPLYVAGLHGMFGYIFTDLIEHVSVSTKDLGNQPRVSGVKINDRKTITNVQTNLDEKLETVTITDTFFPLSQTLFSKEIPKQLNRRQMKRLTPVLPLTIALLGLPRPRNPETVIDQDELKLKALQVCTSMCLPESIMSSEYLEHFSKQAFAEFSPVAAILGGALAQDVIQLLSKKESPINNCLLLDAIKTEMPIYYL